MELTPTSETAAGSGPAVLVEAVDVTGLCDEGLSSRLGLIGRAESRLAAMKSEVLAEVGRRHDSGAAQRVARRELRSSRREAKRDVESAARLAELPATSEALGSGEIPQGHARLIARAAAEGSIDEETLLQAAGDQDLDAFAKTVRRHQQDQSSDDGQSILERQRKARKARIFESAENGMFVLSAEFDQITGARIATALTARERRLWHNEDPKDRRTPARRLADALAELICEPAGGKSAGTNLLVIADYDTIKGQLVNARLADGSPIPVKELQQMALSADILPAIFDAESQSMWLGRARRTASDAQRIALIARDQHCVGCGANPLWCRAHHIIWWRDGGPTDFDNLVLVCDDCHHKIHENRWTVERRQDTGKFFLRPPRGASRVAGFDQTRRAADRSRTTPFAQHDTVTIPCHPPPKGRGSRARPHVNTQAVGFGPSSPTLHKAQTPRHLTETHKPPRRGRRRLRSPVRLRSSARTSPFAQQDAITISCRSPPRRVQDAHAYRMEALDAGS